MAIRYPDRFLSIRKVYSVTYAAPAGSTELSLQDKLADAHSCFFRRQYLVALRKYKEIWYWIHAHARPGLPVLDHGAALDYDVDVAVEDFDRLATWLGRVLVDVPPDVRIRFPGPRPDEPVVNPSPLANLGLTSPARTAEALEDRRDRARVDLSHPQRFDGAVQEYMALAEQGAKLGQTRFAADTFLELGAALAAASQRMPDDAAPIGLSGHVERVAEMLGVRARPAGDTRADPATVSRMLKASASASSTAAALYDRAGDNLHKGVALLNLAEALDLTAPGEGAPHRESARTLLPADLRVRVAPGVEVSAATLVAGRPPASSKSAVNAFSRTSNGWAVATLAEERADADASARRYGVYRGGGAVTDLPVDGTFGARLAADVYERRPQAQTLEELAIHTEVVTNVVAYVPYLYFYVLPIAVGDCHRELGQHARAIAEYAKAEIYPYLNHGIEGTYLWLKKAGVHARAGDFHFRQGERPTARAHYNRILTDAYEVPAASDLYQPAAYSAVRPVVTRVARALRTGQPLPAANPEVAGLVARVYGQLLKLNQNLDFLGLADDWYPVLRFKYLQSVARYLAEHAIQAERAYLNFLNAAEQQQLQRIQFENALDLDTKAVEIETRRVEDAQREQEIAGVTRAHADLRLQHAQDAIDEWNTTGWELASVNAALAWASNAANDAGITYTGVQYHGESHDFDTDVEEFYDVVGEWREELAWELQAIRLQRQRDELAVEVQAAALRVEQAALRTQIANLNREVALIRRDGTREVLEVLDDRILDEDLWYRLASAIRDLAAEYLTAAIEAATYMERAYELETDRRLAIIRLDYQSNALSGLLAGDFLLRDIDRFTVDFLNHARKRNPIRQVISLAAEYPLEFAQFLRTGRLPFRTTLEFFDRRYPGTHARKIKKVEVFVEGLVPAEGAHGFLDHLGPSREWRRRADGTWEHGMRVLGADRMVLSSYQHRRDIAVFRSAEELLDLFENSGVEASWTLGLPRASNDLDYEAITDVKLVLYLEASYDASLAAHVAAFYPTTGAASLALSARFHFPDQYFAFDRTREVAYTLHPSRFPYNRTDRRLSGLSVRLFTRAGVSPADRTLELARDSDGAALSVTTDAQGAVLDGPGSPLLAWANGPVHDRFIVRVPAGSALAPADVEDVQLGVRYGFAYRPGA